MRRALVVLAIACAPALVHAQTSQADAVFFEARQLVADGKYAEACPLFEKSQQMRPGIGTLLNLADCYEKLGKPVDAFRTFRDARDAAKRAGDPRDSVASSRIEALKGKVTLVTLTVDAASDVAGLAIRIDGQPIDRTTEIVIARGAHKVEASAPSKPPFELALDASADTATATIAFPVREDIKPPDVQPRSTQRTIGIIVAGAGLAGVVVGASFGIASIANKGTGDQHCKLGPAADQCDPMGIDARNSALTFGDFSTAFFVAGGVALAAGIIVWLVAPHASKTAFAPIRGFQF